MADFQFASRPYPGLRPFESWEAEIFFGREQHTDRLLEILQRERFLAVVGPSGSGKSSLVRAGLLPILPLNAIGTGSDWRIVIIRPGNRPLQRLATALLSADALGPELLGERLNSASGPGTITTDVAMIEAELRRGPRGLVHVLRDARRNAVDGDFNLLVLVDQFEEIFTYADAGSSQANEADALVNLLLESRGTPDAAHGERRLFLALTMRTDFLGDCTRFLDLPEAINRAQYLTPRLNRQQLESAITGPARLFGGTIEPSLVQELINAAGRDPDQLPVLQDALARMWDLAKSRDAAAPAITWADHDAAGGLRGALDHHAEEIFNGLTAPEQVAAEILFRAITEQLSGDASRQRVVRRPQTLAQIGAWGSVDWHDFLPVLAAFAAEGVNFLQHGQTLDGDAVIDISHEALIRQWQRLADWVASEARRAGDYRRWRDRADDYARGEGGLLEGGQLVRALEWSQPGEVTLSAAASSLWQPSLPWARRYALVREDEQCRSEFQGVIDYIGDSRRAELAEKQRQLALLAEAQQQEQQLREAEQVARAEAARAELEARARAEAQKLAGRLRTMTVVLALALVTTVTLGALGWQAKREALALARRAEVLRLSAEGQALVAEGRNGSDLRGMLELLAAYQLGDRGEVWSGILGAAQRQSVLIRALEGAGSVITLSHSPDGRRLLTGTEDGRLCLRDALTGAVLGRAWQSHDGKSVNAVAFSPDGKTLVSAGDDGSLRLWDADTRRAKGEPLINPGGAPLAVAFSPDGLVMVSAGMGGALQRWQVDSGSPLGGAMVGHHRPVYSVSFSADGQRIVSASADASLRLWDGHSGQALGVLRGHKSEVYAANFSPDGKLVVSASADQSLRLWRSDTGAAVGTPLLGHQGPVYNVSFNPDGHSFASVGADQTVRLWSLEHHSLMGEPLVGHGGSVTALSYRPDGTALVSGSNDGSLRLWRPNADGNTISTPLLGHDGPVFSVAISPNGKTIVSSGADGSLRLWDTASQKLLGEPLKGHGGPVNSAQFSPDGHWLASAGDDGSLRLWDVAQRVQVGAPLLGHSDRIFSVVFSPDGKTLLSASQDGSLRLWDRASQSATGVILKGHSGPVYRGVFSPDGRLVASAGADKTVRLWNTRSGVQEGQALQGHSGMVYAVAFSPDGKLLASAGADQTVRLWNVASHEQIGQPMAGHTESVLSVAFSPDGRHILSSSVDATLRFWDSVSRRPLGQALRGHGDSVYGAVFSPDEQLVVSASRDGSLRLWPTFNTWVDSLCAKLPRNMSHPEWHEWVAPAMPYVRQCPNLPIPDGLLGLAPKIH